jgi:acetylornithine deacetylase/succinyl-diaminopimelate desuccinylase family protein
VAGASKGQISARIRAEVERWTDELIALTSSFIEIPSENPPGTHMVEAQDWIRDQLERFAIPFDVIDSSRSDTDHRVIVGKVGGEGPVMYLHGHYDVVPAFAEDQFSARVVNGSIVGRGASDMKSGLVAMMVAAVIHRDIGGAGQIRLICVPDEETGGADGAERLGALGVLEDSADVVGAIVGEPSWPHIWYAARGAFTVEVTVRGKAAHVGLHYRGNNAFELAHGVLGKLFSYRDKIAEHKTDLRIEPEAARSSIMLIGGVSGGGTNFNIVPDEFSFTIDRRPNPDEDYMAARAELLAELENLAETTDLTIEVLQDVAPANTAIDDPLVSRIEQAITAANGRRAQVTMCPGCLETRIYNQRGIPAVGYGPGPMASMHAPDEHVPIENLVEACFVYATVLQDRLGSN